MSILDDVAAGVGWPDHAMATQAHDQFSTQPELGRLAAVIEWLAGIQASYPVRPIARPRLIIAAADHPIAESGASRFSPADTVRHVEAIRTGAAPLCELAAIAGAAIRVEEVDPGAELTPAIARGVEIADAEIDAGADLLIAANLGAGSTTIAAAVVSILAGTEPVKVIGRGGSRIDDTGWMHKITAIRDARRVGLPHRSDPVALLQAVGAPDIGLLAGVLLGAAARRTPVLFDGVVAAAAALVVDQARPGIRRWWQPAQLTSEPAQAVALRELALTPILDLDIDAGDGTGGLVALGVIRSAFALTRTPADSADV